MNNDDEIKVFKMSRSLTIAIDHLNADKDGPKILINDQHLSGRRLGRNKDRAILSFNTWACITAKELAKLASIVAADIDGKQK